MNKIIDTAIKLGIIVILILAATTTQQYSFYLFVRWAVMGTSIYFAYTTFKKQQIGIFIYYCILVILFNPFKIISLQKQTWHIIDYLVSFMTLGTLYFDWSPARNKNVHQN